MKARSRQRPLAGLLILVPLAGILGCALVPGMPAGPLGGRGLRAGVTYAYAYAPASAETTAPSGAPVTLRGNSEMFRGSLPTFVPLRAMVRANPTSFLDVGADIGWMDAGLQLRAGPLDRQRRLPWGIELEWRTGQPTFFDDALARRARAYRARVEVYPALGRLGHLDAFGVLKPIPAGLEVSRDETRLEASLGAHGYGKPLAITIAVQPWLGLHQGAVRGASCGGCSLEFQSLDVDWGLGVLAGGSLVWEKD